MDDERISGYKSMLPELFVIIQKAHGSYRVRKVYRSPLGLEAWNHEKALRLIIPCLCHVDHDCGFDTLSLLELCSLPLFPFPPPLRKKRDLPVNVGISAYRVRSSPDLQCSNQICLSIWWPCR